MSEPVTPINQEEINKAVWAACDTFRGTIDASVYTDFILVMLFLKFVSDVYNDEHARLMEQYGNEQQVTFLMQQQRFTLPESANFWTLYKHRHEPGNGQRINEALAALEDANGSKLRNVFQDISFNTDKLGEEKQKNSLLRTLLEDFAKPQLDLSLSRVGSLDIIGNAYEFLIGKFAADAGRKAGEYYTPPEVSDLLARLLDPRPGETICDPACGSASLLMKCGRRIFQKTGQRDYALYGQESIGATWALAKMNLFLHGEDNHRLEWGDTLRNPKLLDKDGRLLHFDVVTANPPFSLDKWGIEEAEHDPHGRFRRGLPPRTKGDYAFILHMIETLRPGTGRMGVVVPHGVLFRGAAEGRIRKQLLQENLLSAVIGLPEKLFFGTGIPAAILVFQKRKSDENVLFIDASRDFRPGKNQNQLMPEHIERIVSTFTARQPVDKYAALVPIADILSEHDGNLNIPRYVDTFEEEEEIDLLAVRAERRKLDAELATLETQMAAYLKELGYDEEA